MDDAFERRIEAHSAGLGSGMAATPEAIERLQARHAEQARQTWRPSVPKRPFAEILGANKQQLQEQQRRQASRSPAEPSPKKPIAQGAAAAAPQGKAAAVPRPGIRHPDELAHVGRRGRDGAQVVLKG